MVNTVCSDVALSEKKVILTGITPSGLAHLGNYIGAIKPALKIAKSDQYEAFFFVADYHSLTRLKDPELRQEYIYDIAATWLTLGLEPEKMIFYRQSKIPEILEMNWILNSVTAKGMLNRSHAYKSIINQNNTKKKTDIDAGINMSLFNYPVLMAADILTFQADFVPVGGDQIQHIEITRDIANCFNKTYKKDTLTLPRMIAQEETKLVVGLDGRKMSKSYKNTIPLFISSKHLRKLISRIVTNSQKPEEPKLTKSCTIFSLYEQFGTQGEINELKSQYEYGISWGDAKQMLFEKIDTVFKPYRDRYNYLKTNRHIIDQYFREGQHKARIRAKAVLSKIKKVVGM
jgi:tryptophanyl-tRNA synthetase